MDSVSYSFLLLNSYYQINSRPNPNPTHSQQHKNNLLSRRTLSFNKSNEYNIFTNQLLMMKIVLLACIVQASIQASAGPTWTVNAFLNAGEHKPISGTSTAPSTIPTSQTFNTAFAVAPRVILSLEGYKQNAPCAGCQVGFKYTINTVTTTGFTGSVTVYGANMFYLLYTYMGVAYAATEYFTSYQLLTFSSGNLVDTASANRSLTQIFNNPAGESFPNFPTNTIVSTIFLAGFKMNLGTTGTYINLTSRAESASTHSITIATRGDVQIYEVCYFRIAFDKTAIMQGYINIIDYMYIWGANSTQQVSPNPLPAGGFLYRNYMMGFNQISLPGASQVSDIMLQFHTTPQIIWASSSVVFNFVGTTYEYLWADIFHHRKRNCAVGTPYYNYQNQLCYDVCPSRTFPVTPTQYCQKCHYSCLTCTATLNVNCSTCDSAGDFRGFNSTTSECLCLAGYFDNNTAICPACASPCVTCVTSASTCLSCDLPTHHRTLNSTANTCICANGYYETSANTPLVCLACDPTCITCSSSATFCLTCDLSTQHRTFNSTSNACLCTNGYYETSTNSPTVCLACHPTCITCQSSSTYCLTCDLTTQKRVLNATSNVCGCTNGFYETSVNTPTVCLSCDPTCITCSSSATFCLSCDSTHQRTLNAGSNICQCNNGFYETSTNSPVVCLACNYQCVTCSSSSSCSTCDLATHHRQLNANLSALCPCVTGYYDNGSNQTCLQCDAKCLTCSSSATNCLSCDTTIRFLTGSTCSCNGGTQESPSVYGQCIPIPTPAASICGNGIVESGEACDDFNSESNDGCSSACQVEVNHVCEQYSNRNGTSLCYYSKPLAMVIESVLKELNDNKITITIKIEALLCNIVKLKQYLDSLVAIELSSSRRLLVKQKGRQLASTIIYISSANFVITDATNYQGYLNLVLEYTESISTLQNKRLSFLSSNAQQSTLSKSYFFATPTSNIILQDPYNKIPMNFYKAESYQSAIGLSYVFLVIIVLNFLFFIVLVFMRKSVVPVESILIFQFAYFCVAGQKEVELAVASLAYFGKFSLGININFIKSVVLTQNENYQICSKMGKIYQECSSLNNINITFYLAIVLFFFYLGCVIFKFKKQRDLDNKEKEVVNEDPEVSARQRENLSDENDEFREQEQSQTGSNQSNQPIIYELPLKIKNASFICLEFSFGMIFLTAIEYLLTAVNQNDLLKTASIIWLAIVGVFFAALWVVWFYSYPLDELSYVQILKKRLEKISLEKFAYLGLFLFLTVWGVLLAIAPGIAAYSVLIVWCLFWLYLSVRKQIYQSRLHKLRSFINQAITIIIALLFIVLEYVPNDGMGLGYSIAILLLLLGSLICNVVLFAYDAYLERRNKKLNEDVDQFKQVEDQFKNYSSRKSHVSEQIKEKSIWDDKVRNNPQLKLFQMTAPKRELLIDSTQIKETARSKANQLKSFRKLLKFQNGPLPDEKRTQLLSQVRKMNGEVKLEQDSQYRGL